MHLVNRTAIDAFYSKKKKRDYYSVNKIFSEQKRERVFLLSNYTLEYLCSFYKDAKRSGSDQ